VANYHQFLFKGDIDAMALYPKNVHEKISKGTSEPRANRLNQQETETILKEVFTIDDSDVIPTHKGKYAGLEASSNQLKTFLENDTTIKILDKHQKEYVEKKQNGFLSIRGVPGSGKSVILTKRFERFSKISGKRILFVYFTGTLDRYYQKLLDVPQQNNGLGNINVMTFARLSQKFFNEHSRKYDYESRNASGETILKKIRSIKEYQKFIGYFDFVLVDEGQDFPPSWAEILKIMTKGDGVNKPITVAYDPDQNLSKAKIRDILNNFDIPRNSGNSVILNKVYRNTREVFEYAMTIIGDIDPILGSRKEIEYEREDSNSCTGSGSCHRRSLWI
jgi:superfamily I DNA and RNA helicase